MSKITKAEAYLVDIPVETVRTDAVQAFLKQETIFVEVRTADGGHGTGYSYTIGTGGTRGARAAARLPAATPGRPRRRAGWRRSGVTCTPPPAPPPSAPSPRWRSPRSTPRCGICAARAAGLPLWVLAGGAKDRIPLYDTEGGWLHLTDGRAGRRGEGLPGGRLARRQAQGGQAEPGRGRGADRRGPGGPGRPLRHDGRRQPVADRRRRRSAGPGCSNRTSSPGSRSRCRPTTSPGTSCSPARPASRSRWGSRCTRIGQFAEYLRRAGAPASSRSTSRGSVASPRGSRSRTWPRRATWWSARTS